MVLNFLIADAVQNHMLAELIGDMKKFLSEYDTIVFHKELYRSFFLYTLSILRGKLANLLRRFSTLPQEDFEDKVIECCGVWFNKSSHFQHHYSLVHNKRPQQAISLCELKMAVTKIALLERRVCDYLVAGEIANCEMILYLRQILKKIDTTLEFSEQF
ncbi:uncharacterized protein LOC131681340 [Topomyia yanbarensis]|uniref:uncharacterized protein LOC131681340 n=1 Tax=Topomyia yanbarensis TaxID=2498891 RepID=UPI00273C7E63|nr:uncharacterized protein LOC131681340 [Topomyia yanbarensis]